MILLIRSLIRSLMIYLALISNWICNSINKLFGVIKQQFSKKGGF
jgi:hypothetical protein